MIPVPIARFANKNCAAQQKSPCRCNLSSWTVKNLNDTLVRYQEQIKNVLELGKDVTASQPRRTSADQSIKASIENIDELHEKNSRILRTMKAEIQRALKRQTHIAQHREQIAEAERKAKEKPLRFIADGSKSSIHEVPESLGKRVIRLGPLKAIEQGLLNTLLVAQAQNRFEHSIWSGSRQGWLRSLLIPKVEEFVPTGWVRDDFTGVLRQCESLDPRIPGFYDMNGDRMCVDSDEQVGIVLSRIEDLEDQYSREVLQRCFKLSNDQLEEILDANDHFLVRIYLGRRSDEDDTEDAVSDVTMKDAASDGSIANFNELPLSTLNLPGYLDRIIMACGEEKSAHPLESIAQEIAFGYALLHWGARLDGRGIEFLLGSSPTGLGKRLYMLDFEDCCPLRELSARCVRDQIVPAALENEPYIPRAISWKSSDEDELCELCKKHKGYHEVLKGRKQKKNRKRKKVCASVCVWKAFVESYRYASAKIWEARNHDFDLELSEVFIEELKRGFFEQDAEKYRDGVSDHHVALEDGAHSWLWQDNDMETEQGENNRQQEEPDIEDDHIQDYREPFDNYQYGNHGYDYTDDSSEGEQGGNDGREEGPEYGDEIEDDQNQQYGEPFENGQFGDNGYDSDAMDTGDSSEGEQVSDEEEDDDDYDDVD